MTSVKTKLPVGLRAIHFIGIGGIGMSGIAEVLLSLGYNIQGSDTKTTEITQRLSRIGAKVFIGHDTTNLEGAEVIVISSAIKSNNIELKEAYIRSLPVVSRAEMLAELMRLKSNIAVSGTHGKTTTTTMISAVLDKGGLDPTVINGGIIHAYGSNARMGQGEWMVVEADESDGTFTRLPATIAVVTNIDPEHLDHWGNFENLKEGFLSFITNIPFYGVVICCIDNPEVRNLVIKIKNKRVISYGFHKDADIRAVKLNYEQGNSTFDIIFKNKEILVQGFKLPMPGDHNISNSLAAVAVAHHLSMPIETVKEAIEGFKGVNRRFTELGTFNGIKIIDDYVHHPVEISAVLQAARQITVGKVIAIHQPHRYTRMRDLFESFCTCFENADHILITEIFSAGEEAIDGISQGSLVCRIIDQGHKNVHSIVGFNDCKDLIISIAQEGDVIIFLGAGSISSWAKNLSVMLSAREIRNK